MTKVRWDRTFNSPLETGVRAVCILLAAYPNIFDLQRLMAFDHLIVHTGDVGGPQSLHPSLPLRSSEILVRRDLIERSLLLMMSRDLIERRVDANGFNYGAGEMAETFLSTITSPYLIALRERGDWVVRKFGDLDDDALQQTMRSFFDRWIEEFQAIERSMEVKI